ncbi:MAG: TRAP transporter small permease subunit [Burkholderiales bacterium]|jgi:TRAP-type mannitol/chloroaromatic compound transport system permease small subunit|nr:TRAP transporter small permease subunit [Burkholderiales bacterium]
MNALLAYARLIDVVTDKFGAIAKWAVILSCFISATNAVVRYTASYSSNAFLEIQWYLFAACVMLGAAQVLRVNEHVRVDVFYGRLGGQRQVYVDLFGLIFFLVPVMTAMIYFSTPLFVKMFETREMSNNAGGLIRWPAMLMLPLGFTLVLLQGIGEIIKRIAWLQHKYDMDIHYERPLQ